MDIQKMTASQCVAAIIAEMDAVKKAKGDNVNYKFRNIDQVMDVVNPYLGKYGLAPNTEVVQYMSGAFEAVKKGYQGAPDTIVRKTTADIKVRIRLVKEIWLENGTLLTTTVNFEGVAASDDSGDKALTQAQSNAVKYAYIIGFCMKSADKDPDDKNDENTLPKTPPATTPVKPPVTPPATTTPPAEPKKVAEALWKVVKTYAEFENIVINSPITESKAPADKGKNIFVLKLCENPTAPAKEQKGVFFKANVEDLKKYYAKHENELKAQSIALPPFM